MTFDSACRVLLFDVAKSMAYNWKKNRNMVVVHIWKNRTIFFSSKRSNWQHRSKKLEELTMKIEDVEALVDGLPILPMTRRLRSLLIL